MAVYLYESNHRKIPKWLAELLDKNEPIKLDSEYINDYYNITDATEDNINNWKGDALFLELKSDMDDWCQSIAAKIRQIPGVASAKVKGSESVGMSTYINVNFVRPTEDDKEVQKHIKDDPKFLTHYFSGFGKDGGYEGEYRLKFRVSNHKPKYTDANVLVNILNHNYNWIESKIVEMCKKRVTQLDSYWKNYLSTGVISPKQIKRNKARKDDEDVIIIELLKQKNKSKSLLSIEETFGKDRIYSMLDDNVIDYLNVINVDLEDIAYEIEHHFNLGTYDYVTLLQVAAKCLNQYIIEYTFEESFDYSLLFQDMEEELSEINQKHKLLV